MPTTDHDLRSLLAERSGNLPPSAGPQRLSGVQGRVRRIKQRRAAAGSLAAVLLVTGVALAPSLFEGPERRKATLMPAHDQKVAGGLLPRYAEGTEATAYAVFDTDKLREKSLTFTPKSLDFHIEVVCDEPLPYAYMISYEINDKPTYLAHCTSTLPGSVQLRGHRAPKPPATPTPAPSPSPAPSASAPTPASTMSREEEDEQKYARDYGIELGKPVTVTARIIPTPAEHRDTQTAVGMGASADDEKVPTYTGSLSTSRVAVAVYTPVPRADYPLPPRPAELKSLDENSMPSGEGKLFGIVDSREVGPNGRGTIVVPMTKKAPILEIQAVAPGVVRVHVNDVLIHQFDSWTWTGSGTNTLLLLDKLAGAGLNVKTGDELKVVISGSQFDVAGWRAAVSEDTWVGYVAPCTAKDTFTPCGEGLEQGVSYHYALRTSCGIQGLYADGRYWVPVPGQDVGDHNPPAGFDESLEVGNLVGVDSGKRVEFESSDGTVIVFEPGSPPKGECN